MSIRLVLLGAACAGLFAGLPALAQSASANVQIDQFSYELIDLDLTDQITPAISFTERMSAYSSYGDHTGHIELQHINTIGTVSVRRESGSASAATSATGADAHARFDEGMPSPGSDFQQFSAWAIWGWDIELTPATAVIIRALATLDATQEDQHLSAVSTVLMNGRLGKFDYPYLVDQSAFSDYFAINQGQAGYELFGYMHTGPDAGRGVLDISISATVRAMSPAPEPPAWAMLAAGLALFRRRLLRQRSKRPAHDGGRSPFQQHHAPIERITLHD